MSDIEKRETNLPIYIEKAIEVWGQEKVRLLKDAIAPDLTMTELGLFIEVARTKGLDPFSRQIYAMKRWDSKLGREKMTIMTGIDGFRTLAERTGKYVGQRGPFWCGEDGEWRDVWLSDEQPRAAKIEVLRSDFTEPLVGVAVFREYAQTKRDGSLTRMWQQMGSVMAAKCAESIALRRAFPSEIGGLYTADEMGQAETVMHHEEDTKKAIEATKPIAVGGGKPDVVEADFTEPQNQPRTGQAIKPTGASSTKLLLAYFDVLDAVSSKSEFDAAKSMWATKLSKLSRGGEYVDAFEAHVLSRNGGEPLPKSMKALVDAVHSMRTRQDAIKTGN